MDVASIAGVEYYEVRWRRVGIIAYRGTSLVKAASALEPGTCYGRGLTPGGAHEHAEAEASKFREAARV